jgi:hypothetical protein
MGYSEIAITYTPALIESLEISHWLDWANAEVYLYFPDLESTPKSEWVTRTIENMEALWIDRKGPTLNSDNTLTQIYSAEESENIDHRIESFFTFLTQQGFGVWGDTVDLGGERIGYQIEIGNTSGRSFQYLQVAEPELDKLRKDSDQYKRFLKYLQEDPTRAFTYKTLQAMDGLTPTS